MLLSLIISGCSKASEVGDKNEIKDTKERAISKEEIAKQEEMNKKVLSFLEAEPSNDQIGSFIVNELNAYSDSNDLLFERLILSSSEMARDLISYQHGSSESEEEFYNIIYFDLLDGFDPSKIEVIANDNLRALFTSAYNGFLTIIRYEETPVFELDYKRLNEYSQYFGDHVAHIIDYNSRLKDSSYVSGLARNYNQLVEDIVLTEGLLSKEISPFLKKELKSLLSAQLFQLFVGPEGSYFHEIFESGDIKNGFIAEIPKKYPNTKIAEISNKLLSVENNDPIEYSNIIHFSSNYILDNDIVISNFAEENENYRYEGFTLEGIDKNISLSIYNALSLEVNEYIDEKLINLRIGAWVFYLNDNYISVYLNRSYNTENGSYQYDEQFLNFDLKAGKKVNLNDLFDQTYGSYKLRLEKEIGFTVEENAIYNFYITQSGITLVLNDENYPFPQYVDIHHNTLRKFMDITKIY